MSELKKLLKARERLVAQREWATAGARFYVAMQSTAQASIRDVDSAIEKIKAATADSADIAASAPTGHKSPAARKQATPTGTKKLPATGNGFWFRFLGSEWSSMSTVFDNALSALRMEHKFTPNAEQRNSLRNRLAVAFHGAVGDKVILSRGHGRDRLYRLPKGKPGTGAKSRR